MVTWIPISSLIQICPNTYLFNQYWRVLYEIDQTQITNCKSRLWMCKLKYLAAIQRGIQPQIKADFRVIFEYQVELFVEVCLIIILKFWRYNFTVLIHVQTKIFFCRFSCFWSCSSTAWSRRRFYLSLWQFPEESLTTFQTKMQVAFFPDNKCFPVIECPEFGSYLFSGGSKIEHI